MTNDTLVLLLAPKFSLRNTWLPKCRDGQKMSWVWAKLFYPNLMQHMQHMYMTYPAAGHTCQDIDDLLQPLENAIHQHLIPCSTSWATTMPFRCEKSTSTSCPSWWPWSLWSISDIFRKFSILRMHHCTTYTIDSLAGCKSNTVSTYTKESLGMH